MIEYLLRQDDSRGFTSLIQRKAITEFYFLNDKNKKNTASFLATRTIASGSKESPAKLEDQWRSCIKYYLANIEDTKHVGLEEFIQYFLENGRMKNMRNKDSANFLSPTKTRAACIAPGPKPVWGHLEVRFAEWIKEMHEQKMAVTRVLVLHKALEFEPNFMGGPLDSDFIKRAMKWYHRFIARRKYNLSMWDCYIK
jgi:hypothetical protein